jgi:hypothetical protein
MEAVADKMGLDSASDLRRVLKERLTDARSGTLTDARLDALDSAVDCIQRLDALDHPWVFAQRYLRHKFISTDPICPNCDNEVPHRTILMCPSCGKPGPWDMREHAVRSSYVHYYLAHQVSLLVKASLLMPGGESYADGMATALARGGAKSTWLLEITGLWLVLTLRSRCLLVLSNTTDQVAERCNEIKTELEENTKIIEDFGEQIARRADQRVWTRDEFILPNRSRVIGKGAMQSMRGVKNNEYRPDAVISDDSDDDKFINTPEMANKMWGWWDQRVVPACHPNAIFMFHGTVIGEMGLLWQILTGHRGATFRRQTFEAIQERPGCSQCGMPSRSVGPMDCPVCNERTSAIEPCSYWGARFTVQALETIRNKIGHWAWQTEFKNKPHDDSTSWFKKDWIDGALRHDLAPLTKQARRVIPGSIIECTLSGEEAVKISTMADPEMKQSPGDLGPYQLIVQSWDPAWARKTGKDQLTAWMAGCGMGLTWDDKFDLFWIDRDKGLTGTSAYREWMYRTWNDDIVPSKPADRPGQIGMIIERNGAGVLFQSGVEEYWGSIPVIDHQTGTEKHDLTDGVPGMASDFCAGKFIIRYNGSEKYKQCIDELVYELKNSGTSLHTDLMMCTWFAWAYIRRWMRDVRDPGRYEELVRRRTLEMARGRQRRNT